MYKSFALVAFAAVVAAWDPERKVISHGKHGKIVTKGHNIQGLGLRLGDNRLGGKLGVRGGLVGRGLIGLGRTHHESGNDGEYGNDDREIGNDDMEYGNDDMEFGAQQNVGTLGIAGHGAHNYQNQLLRVGGVGRTLNRVISEKKAGADNDDFGDHAVERDQVGYMRRVARNGPEFGDFDGDSYGTTDSIDHTAFDDYHGEPHHDNHDDREADHDDEARHRSVWDYTTASDHDENHTHAGLIRDHRGRHRQYGFTTGVQGSVGGRFLSKHGREDIRDAVVGYGRTGHVNGHGLVDANRGIGAGPHGHQESESIGRFGVAGFGRAAQYGVGGYRSGYGIGGYGRGYGYGGYQDVDLSRGYGYGRGYGGYDDGYGYDAGYDRGYGYGGYGRQLGGYGYKQPIARASSRKQYGGYGLGGYGGRAYGVGAQDGHGFGLGLGSRGLGLGSRAVGIGARGGFGKGLGKGYGKNDW